jgi:hypothetical protein
MLHDLDFSDPADPRPRFFRARLDNGAVRRAGLTQRGGAGMILQALHDYYQRKQRAADPQDRLPAFGLEEKEIPFHHRD